MPSASTYYYYFVVFTIYRRCTNDWGGQKRIDRNNRSSIVWRRRWGEWIANSKIVGSRNWSGTDSVLHICASVARTCWRGHKACNEITQRKKKQQKKTRTKTQTHIYDLPEYYLYCTLKKTRIHTHVAIRKHMLYESNVLLPYPTRFILWVFYSTTTGNRCTASTHYHCNDYCYHYMHVGYWN